MIMLTTIFSGITVLAAIGIAFISGKARRRIDADLNAAVARSTMMLSEMRAIRDAVVTAGPIDAADQKEAADGHAIWASEVAAISAKLSALRASQLVLERHVDEAQFFRDRMVSILSIRGSGAERLTDVDGRWLLERDACMAKSLRATRRRERGIPQSRELPGWTASVR